MRAQKEVEAAIKREEDAKALWEWEEREKVCGHCTLLHA